MRRVWTALLALAVLLSLGTVSVFAQEATEELTITVDQTLTVDVAEGETVCLKFVPEVSGTYTFSADSGLDTIGYLYDENKNQLAYNDDSEIADTLDCAVTYDLSAGTVYYWGVRYYSVSRTGSFPVTLVCDKVFCPHENVTESEEQPANCTTEGYTAGTFCEDCKTWITGHKTLPVQHTDDDLNLFCDLCDAKIEGKYSGTCGNALTWDLYENGTLVISGEGEMWHWHPWREDAPWLEYSEQIHKVIIREGVTSIGQHAFCSKESYYGSYLYTYLREIEIPNTVTTIHTNGLCGLDALETITLPASVTELVGAAMNNNKSLRQYVVNEENSAYKAVDGVLFTMDGKTLVSYPIGCLEESYTVPQGTETIAAYAFSQCSEALAEVIFNEELTFIDDEAFQNCVGLTKIELPDSLKELGGGVFQECSALAEISLPEDMTRIGGRAFDATAYYHEWENWEDGVLYIGDYLVETVYAPWFLETAQKKSGTLTVRQGTTLIADEAVDSSDVNAVEFNPELQYIGFAAFSGLGLTEIDLPAGMVSLGDWAFYGCELLGQVQMSPNLKHIGFDALGKTPYYNTDNYVDGVLYFGPYVLSFNDALPENVVLREGTKLIAERAFWIEDGSLSTPDYGAGMKSITFPESLTTICDGAFYSCNNLKTATVPATVTSIGSQAFGWIKGYDTYEDTETFQQMTDFSMEGYADSAAQTYAEENGIPFRVLSDCEHEYASSVTTPHSCTTDGLRTYQCLHCEDSYTEVIPAQHTNVVIDAAVEPGCITIGKTEGSHCEDCGVVIVEQLDTGSLYHSVSYESGKDADCNDEGLTEAIWCNVCQKYVKEPEVIPATGNHREYSMDEIPATCIKEGRTGGTFCGLCGETIQQPTVMPKNNNHTSRVYDAGYGATCTTDGKTDGYHCGDCGQPIIAQQTIPSGGHSYDDSYTVDQPATETRAGYMTRHCNNCSAFTDLVELPPFSSVTVQETAMGLQLSWTPYVSDFVCHVYRTDVGADKTVHVFTTKDGFFIDLDAVPGSTYFYTFRVTDERNGAFLTVATIKTDSVTFVGTAESHKYSGACDTTCNECGETRNALESHSYNAATCTAPKTCKTCGATTGSKLGHTYANDCDTTCNRCGATRTAGAHKYDHACDTTCNTCGAKRTITHSYNAATCTKAKTCKVCGATSGSALGHKHTNACDTTCNTCGAKRTITHSYNVATCTKAKTCKVCGATNGSALGHKYSNDCDASCNTCGAKRTVKHTNKTTTTKATLKKNGSVVKKCTECGEIASKKTVKRIKSVKLSKTSYTYNGKTKTPSVVVKDSSGKTLKKGTDYTVTYAKGRKTVGTYKVTIKFKGSYSGTKVLTFKITPPKTVLKKVTPKNDALKISIDKETKQVTGYQVQYSTSKTFKKATTKTVKSYKTTSLTLKNLKSNKKYYVRVRTYKVVDGTRYYSGWSTSKTARTK